MPRSGIPATYSATYAHDTHGNMTAMPHLAAIEWDHADRMQHADLGGGGDVYFQYDAAGNRVRKVRVNTSATAANERVYLGAVELYRERAAGSPAQLGGIDVERQTLHIADDTGRIVMVETLTIDGGSPVPSPANVSRYQYGNHLGTVALELDDAAAVISYEEYHPYGTSAYRAVDSTIEVSAKRYRYTGKERDEETGLDPMGLRYYAPWLGRWTAADPIGLGDGVNRYAYVSGNPVGLRDPSGTFARDPTLEIPAAEAENATFFEAPMSTPEGTVAEGQGPEAPVGVEEPPSEQARAAAEQRAQAMSEREPPTEAELRAEAAAEREASRRAARQAQFRPGAHLEEPPNPVAVETARQGLGVAVALRQLAVGLFTLGAGEVVLATPEERDAAGTAAATLTTLGGTIATVATARPGATPSPRPSAPAPRTRAQGAIESGAPAAKRGGVTVFRVEGTPNTRVLIGESGEVAITGEQTLFLNFGNRARAEAFLQKRLSQGMPGAEVKSFEVPQSFLDDLRAAAVPESKARLFPGRPIIADPTKAPDQFGLRPEQIEALQQAIHQGSGKRGF